MLNNIAIGSSVILDLQARTLTRVHDGKSVTLPVSACNCLKALVEAREQVLSQEQLMDVGWRNSGVEVTENSIRVMINKIRRALVTLEVQNSITLLTVKRSGYLLIIREPSIDLNQNAQQAEAPAPLNEIPATTADQSPIPANARKKLAFSREWKRRIFGGFSGIVLGTLLGLFISWMAKNAPEPVIFTRWNGTGIPVNTEVWIPVGHRSDDPMIHKTLELYSDYALKREAKSDKASYLYITLGHSPKFLGLIACLGPLHDVENNCESYYFRYH